MIMKLIRTLLICLIFANVALGFTQKCGYHEFDCDNHSRCILLEEHCNGVVNCVDKTDEESCGKLI